MPHHIFLSYSRKDSEIMQRVKSDFLAAGLSVWTDEGIEPGTRSWKKAIEEAIIAAECLVCVLSPDAKASPWVQAELDHAELHGKPIFLILARGNERSSIPFGFASFQWVDIRADGQYTPGVTRLIGTVHKRLGVEQEQAHRRALLQPPDVSGILPPPFEWCEVPAGKVTLTNLGGYLKEQTTFEVGQFWMAKYPITNAQFRVFVDALDGYRNSNWWSYSSEAQKWRKRNGTPEKPSFKGDDLPLTNVTWYEAVAFCRWMGWKLDPVPKKALQIRVKDAADILVRLPTEQEWQRAAQGDDSRVYPWGNRFEEIRANTIEGGAKMETPVTQYPEGASPFGIVDMAGNVNEWSITAWESGNSNIDNDKPRVLRGGSWLVGHQQVRVVSRGANYLHARDILFGFRVVAAPASSF